MSAPRGPDWGTYLASFHAARPGVTEDLLSAALDSRGTTAYEWAAEPVPSGSRVVDLACGSAPMHRCLPDCAYLGLDLSRSELALAAARASAVVQADATRLPLPTGSRDVVIMSMALMLAPLEPVLHEVRRVLRPGGLFVATVPAGRPLPRRDQLRYSRLCVALRVTGLTYPNDDALVDALGCFAAAGLRLLDDDRRAFVVPLATGAQADRLLTSLYLPDVGADRVAAGRRVARSWVGSTLTVPIRRLVARG